MARLRRNTECSDEENKGDEGDDCDELSRKTKNPTPGSFAERSRTIDEQHGRPKYKPLSSNPATRHLKGAETPQEKRKDTARAQKRKEEKKMESKPVMLEETVRALNTDHMECKSSGNMGDLTAQATSLSCGRPSGMLDYLSQAEVDLFVDDTDDGLNEFIVSDSVSEEELYREPPASTRKKKRESPRRMARMIVLDSEDEEYSLGVNPEKRVQSHEGSAENPSINDRELEKDMSKEMIGRNGNFCDSIDSDSLAKLELLLPKRNPFKKELDLFMCSILPMNPLQVNLPSNNTRARDPRSSYHHNLESFWSQETKREWNDQYYSSEKTQTSQRRVSVQDSEGDEILKIQLPIKSPEKKTSKSPARRRQEVLEQGKRLFDAKKHEVATEFVLELDKAVTGGEVSSLAASAGGIHIIWNKKLNSTAGRASWKREAVKVNYRGADCAAPAKMLYRHHASIELAEKVIDDEDRLRNVLAHEFCHLANFMISNVKSNPHGKEFKQWAQKTTSLFTHLNIHVTTKHNYDIAYKYAWTCQACSQLYQRHSRSIDPGRHSCGACHSGKLMQIRPKPRGANEQEGRHEQETLTPGGKRYSKGNDGQTGRKGEYQAFVKANFKRVRKEMAFAAAAAAPTFLEKQGISNGATVSMGAVMAALAKDYRAWKEAQEPVKATTTVVLDGSQEERKLLSPAAVTNFKEEAALHPGGREELESFVPDSAGEEEAENMEEKMGYGGTSVKKIDGDAVDVVARNLETLYLRS